MLNILLRPFRAVSPGILLLILLTIPVFSTFSQHHGGDKLPKGFEEPIPLFPAALGEFKWQISSSNQEAQDFFNQGVQLKYSFGVNEAARSFRVARTLDPNCAICYWGEAWAMGAYLNGGLSKAKAPLAYEATQKAIELADKNANEIERSLIKASTVRFIEDYDPDERRLQDSLYAKAMAPVYNKYPQNMNVATVYAESLFLLERRAGYRDVNDPNLQRIHKILEEVLDKDIRHPGACHLYVHATESSQKPELAEPCAEYLGSSVPGASHINHMPSHTWNEVGRWGESVRANLQAWHSDQKADIGEGVAIYPSHNLHMLLFAASNDGQGAIAIQAGKDYTKLTENSMYHTLTLLRFGRFDEILKITNRPEASIPGAMWDFSQGYARLKNGETDFAKVYLERVKVTADTAKTKFRRHPADELLGTLGGILQGEINRVNGDLEAAIVAFTKAAEIEDSMEYDEPEPFPFAVRHWLGATLLENKQYAEAEKVYKEELEDHPNNGWSLYGLLKAMEAQGKSTTDVKKSFDESWARSDIWIRSSVF